MNDKNVVRSRRSKSGHWTLYLGYEDPALVGAKVGVSRGVGDGAAYPAEISMNRTFFKEPELTFERQTRGVTGSQSIPLFLRSGRHFYDDQPSMYQSSSFLFDQNRAFPKLRDAKSTKRERSKSESKAGDEDSTDVSLASADENVEMSGSMDLLNGRPGLSDFGSGDRLDEFIRNITAIRDEAIAIRDAELSKRAAERGQDFSGSDDENPPLPEWPIVRSRTISELTEGSEIWGPPEPCSETKSLASPKPSKASQAWPSLQTSGNETQTQMLSIKNAVPSASSSKGWSPVASPVPSSSGAVTANEKDEKANVSKKKNAKGEVKIAPPEEWYTVRKRSTSQCSTTCAARRGSDDPNAYLMNGSFAVSVTNLAKNTTWDDMKRLMSPFGDWVRLFIGIDPITACCQGFAHVYFKSRADAAKAIKTLNGQRLRRNIIRVEWSRPVS